LDVSQEGIYQNLIRISHYGIERAGLKRLRENRQSCHPEEAKPTKDLCICLKIQIQGSCASLRMTASEPFPAACEALPLQFRGEESGLNPSFFPAAAPEEEHAHGGDEGFGDRNCPVDAV
jgi:hypothetical protein